MPVVRVFRLTLLLGLGLVSSAAPAPASYPGPNGKIAFGSSELRGPRQRTGNLWTIDADGSRMWPLRRNTTGAVPRPRWSPAGTRLAFTEGGSLIVYGPDGNGGISTPWPVYSVSWSPDARQLAVEAYVDHRTVIAVMDRDGRNPRLLTSGLDSSPAWSPDGRSIAFDRLTDSPSGMRHQIFTISPDGSGLRRLTADPSHAVGPAWSPDGEWIAFTSGPFTLSSDISAIRSDGTDPHKLTDGSMPAWSPDGEKIVFIGPVLEGGLYTINPDGSERVRILYHDAEHPDWQPVHFDLDLRQNVPRTTRVGRRIVFTYYVRNAGDPIAPGVVLRLQLPRKVRPLGVTSERGTCVRSARVVTCSLGDLPPSTRNYAVRVVARVQRARRLVSAAQVGASAREVDETTNRVQATTRVRPAKRKRSSR